MSPPWLFQQVYKSLWSYGCAHSTSSGIWVGLYKLGFLMVVMLAKQTAQRLSKNINLIFTSYYTHNIIITFLICYLQITAIDLTKSLLSLCCRVSKAFWAAFSLASLLLFPTPSGYGVPFTIARIVNLQNHSRLTGHQMSSC